MSDNPIPGHPVRFGRIVVRPDGTRGVLSSVVDAAHHDASHDCSCHDHCDGGFRGPHCNADTAHPYTVTRLPDFINEHGDPGDEQPTP